MPSSAMWRAFFSLAVQENDEFNYSLACGYTLF